jgi:hypothetical protein
LRALTVERCCLQRVVVHGLACLVATVADTRRYD